MSYNEKMWRFSHFFSWQVLFLIILVAASLLFYAASHDSAIFDESAHIPAGYSYVRYFDYRLNHEHPPLVKVLSGIPLLFLDLNFPTDNAAWTTDVNGQWSAGEKFLYEYRNDAEKLIFWARFGPISLTLFLIFFIYIFARQFLGPLWALLPTLLFGLSPNVLAHGYLVTTDIGATFGVIFSFYFFFRYLKKPTKKNIILAGLAFGIAQLLKFSNVLLALIFIVLIAVRILFESTQNWHLYTSGENIKKLFLNFFWEYLRLAVVFLIGFVLIYFVYAIFTLNYQQEMLLRDMYSVIGNFEPAILRNIAFTIAGVGILKPLAVYVFGVYSVLQRTVGGNATFFLGELSGKGWWYYFPVVYLLKETIPVLILFTVALVTTLRRTSLKLSQFGNYVRNNFEIFAMIFYVGFYWLNSIVSPLNIGVRHILPTLPFIYILIALALKQWLIFKNQALVFTNLGEMTLHYLRQLPAAFGKYLFLLIMVVWFLIEVAVISPNYISYFNEFVGTKNGYRYVTDSNYDWGQDLYRLKDWANKNRIQKISVDHFGGCLPKYSLGATEKNWWSS